MPDKPEKADLRFFVNTDGSRDYFTVKLSVVKVENAHIRNPMFSRYGVQSGDGAEYDGFTISAQTGPSDANFYGYEPEFRDVHRVQLAQAESMVKVLKKIDRHLAKLNDRFSGPTDFASYMARVADAIGAKNPAFVVRTSEAAGSSWDDSEYRYIDADGLRYHLQHVVGLWHKQYGHGDQS